ncbi:hypothetical protein [Thioalkalivibrio sp. ALR17-21]|uniref:hypothetical protein n=1 Tax=Thioalkalivibrio sp. ALR17-21 TaxID=1269813 RepID=UPI0012DEC3C7|nr:hypothetical protein [Thioalkalivibrio sp. ALR17-21]
MDQSDKRETFPARTLRATRGDALAITTAAILAASLTAVPASGSEATIDPVFEDHLERLDTLDSALESPGDTSLDEHHEAAEEALDFLSTWERSRRTLARALRARTGDEEHQALVTEFLELADQASQKRLQVPFDSLAAVSGEEGAAHLRENLADLIEAHQKAREAAEAMEAIMSQHDLQPDLVFYGPERLEYSPGEPVNVTILIENPGPRDLGAIQNSLETMPAGAPMSLEPAPRAWDEFPAGETRRLELRGSPEPDHKALAMELLLSGDTFEARHLLQLQAAE